MLHESSPLQGGQVGQAGGRLKKRSASFFMTHERRTEVGAVMTVEGLLLVKDKAVVTEMIRRNLGGDE